jgi:hypothetical protein
MEAAAARMPVVAAEAVKEDPPPEAEADDGAAADEEEEAADTAADAAAGARFPLVAPPRGGRPVASPMAASSVASTNGTPCCRARWMLWRNFCAWDRIWIAERLGT